MSIADNLQAVRSRITAAALRAGRDPAEVRLVAVSKTKPAAFVDEAARCGQPLFGENYAQELAAKAKEVKDPVEWHFIGSLQSNKVRQIAGLVTMIHSVDRFSLAEEIDRQWGKRGLVCDVLIEVNIAGEQTKGGTRAAEVIELARRVAGLSHLRLKGLMTMPPFFDDPEGARPFFRELRRLAQEIDAAQIPRVEMTELSMGMSGDFEAAIEEGATLVRVGSAIFGERVR
ncbi:MAG TPA: YggS family pyridoxal phosphate-dependent enzyme [Geobacteraceae bacterium]|nr:YggS family pyridoxal phosphate-dependent enzyme [Geobacteraceae bacterium]